MKRSSSKKSQLEKLIHDLATPISTLEGLLLIEPQLSKKEFIELLQAQVTKLKSRIEKEITIVNPEQTKD